MIKREYVPLASLTTLRVGGDARFLAYCETEDDVLEALAYAKEKNLPWRVLGQGSNVLASDDGYSGVVLKMSIAGMEIEEQGGEAVVTAGNGVGWDELVREAAQRGLWGIENLAGIPGTVGAAPVQNIGAYGSEVKDTITSVRVLNTRTGEIEAFSNQDCVFGYRESRFKQDPSLIILSVSFRLTSAGVPSVSYKDLAAAHASGVDLSNPLAIGEAVRAIRARKFPDLRERGTAGSFFKNPTVSSETYGRLQETYPLMPGFPNEHGVKIPLAFVLDQILDLRGYREGNVSLFSEQPLVLVAHDGATAREIDEFANRIKARVHDAVGIDVEREVQSFA